MVLLSDQRRTLFASQFNEHITNLFEYEALYVQVVEPDPEFEKQRACCDLADPRPYEKYLAGDHIPNEYHVRENFVGGLHEDKLFVDFLKYLDQLMTEEKLPLVQADKTILDKVASRIIRAMDILNIYMMNLAFHSQEEFDRKQALIKSTLAKSFGEEIAQTIQENKESMDMPADPELRVNDPPSNKAGLRVYTGSRS